MKESKNVDLFIIFALALTFFISMLCLSHEWEETKKQIDDLKVQFEEIQKLAPRISDIEEQLNDILVEPEVEESEEEPIEEEPETPVVTAALAQTHVVESTPVSDVDLIAILVMAEAEGEPELGKRLVVDTVLNRVDHPAFPNTIHDVIYQSGQFTSMTNGRSDRCYVKDDIKQLVLEELQNRTNTEVAFFRTQRYSDYGTPLFVECCHYFSKY